MTISLKPMMSIESEERTKNDQTLLESNKEKHIFLANLEVCNIKKAALFCLVVS